jgi:hypothetical protein
MAYSGDPAYGGTAATGAGPVSYNSVDEPAGGAGCNQESVVSTLTSPPGLLRLVEWFCAVIAFSATADASCDDCFGSITKVSDVPDFQYVIAIGVLVWLYATAALVAAILDTHSRVAWLARAELGVDAVFSFLFFVAGLAGAARCSTDYRGNDITYCDKALFGSKPRVGSAFAFLGALALMGSTFFSYHRNKAAQSSSQRTPATSYY